MIFIYKVVLRIINTRKIVYEKLDLIKKIENNYQIIRPNVVYPKNNSSE